MWKNHLSELEIREYDGYKHAKKFYTTRLFNTLMLWAFSIST